MGPVTIADDNAAARLAVIDATNRFIFIRYPPPVLLLSMPIKILWRNLALAWPKRRPHVLGRASGSSWSLALRLTSPL